MSDENTTAPPISSVSDLPPEPVEAAPLTSTEAKKSSTPDLPPEPVAAPPSGKADVEGSRPPSFSQTKAKAAPSAKIDAGKHLECRSEPRIHVRWHADAFIDGHDVYRGFVKDISLKGADIFLEHSLQKVKFVKLHIYVPPLSVTNNPRVVEVSGKIVYTAYDSNEFLFHTGVNFLQFNLEPDLAYLRSRIASY